MTWDIENIVRLSAYQARERLTVACVSYRYCTVIPR